MKKIIICICCFSLFLTACEKDVIEITPDDQLSSELAFSTPGKMEASLMASYNALQNANYLAGRALIYIDLLGEDVVDKNLFFAPLPRYDLLAANNFSGGLWTAGYSAISTANRVIAGINDNPDVVPDNKELQFIAEAKFVRAVSHFYLVNFFAQTYTFTADASHLGIPVFTENFTSNSPAANKPRATVKVVYEQIIADLSEALEDLPLSHNSTYATKTRGTKAAAAGMLSRVYLYMGDYANAKLHSGNIIAGQYGAFSLNANPAGAFGPGNYTTSETIWSIPNSVSDNPNTNNALPMHYSEFGRNDLVVSPTFMNVATNPYFAADDRRRLMIRQGTTAGNTNYFYTTKYQDVSNRADWAPILRYAEILLTYAEATARLATGISADAVDKLNLVRNRSRVSAPAYTVASFSTKEQLIEAILAERRIELAFEGHRFWDIQRIHASVVNKLDSDFTPLAPLPFGSNKAILPIPQAEIDKSKGVLIQNPGY